jgi:hypothetical protein
MPLPITLRRENISPLALGLLYIEISLSLTKFFETPIDGFERIVEVTRFAALDGVDGLSSTAS